MPRRRSIQWRARPRWEQTAFHGTRRAQPCTAPRTRRTVSGSNRSARRPRTEAAAATLRNGSRAIASDASASAASASANSGQSDGRRRVRRGRASGEAMAAPLQDRPRGWQTIVRTHAHRLGRGVRPPPEFQLVAACCRWPPSPAADEAVRAAAAGLDWTLVARIAERHRVEGLVWSGLRRAGVAVPEAVGERLAAAAGRIARQNLVLAAESLRLSADLDKGGIRHLFVKGISLGALVYGNIALKMGWDIDLLVP